MAVTREQADAVLSEMARLTKAIERTTNIHGKDWPGYGSPETAAVRRASMDVTRALSALRN
jgi:hypothetical protein